MGIRMAMALAAIVLLAAMPSRAGTILISGLINQSTDDGTGPASNNFGLNDIKDNQPYSLLLTFAGNIVSPGSYAGSALTFTVPAAPATESSFGAITLSITPNGGYDEFSLLGCVTTGDCLSGNFLSANFKILTGNLNAQNVAAIGLDEPHPLDLLEDDSVTDIHGTITTYSAVPEPSFGAVLGIVLAAFAVARRFRTN